MSDVRINNNVTVQQPSIVITNNTMNANNNNRVVPNDLKVVPIKPLFVPDSDDYTFQPIRPPTPPPPSIEKPQWDSCEGTRDFKVIREFKLDIDVKELTDKIITAIRVNSGDLTALPTLLNKLHVKIHALFSSEQSKDVVFERLVVKDKETEQEYQTFVKIVLEKENIRSLLGSCFNGRQEKMYHEHILLKPLNKAAELACHSYMNDEVEKLFTK